MKIKLNKIIVHIILMLFVVILVFPFIWLIINSLKFPQDMIANNSFLPRDSEGNIKFTLINYIKTIDYLDFGLLYKNTLIVAVTNTFVNLILNAMAGYSFARMNFKYKEHMFKLVLVSLMIPGTVMLVPHMIIITKLGFYDTLTAVILPSVMSVFNVFLMRQHFMSMSKELEEAALIDGASWTQIFFKIAMPLAKPILIILGLFTFMYNYSNFLWPLVIINDPKKYTLSRGLGKLMTGQGMNPEKYGMMLASAVLVAIPLILLFLVMQKHIVKGINVGGTKE